MDARSFPAKLAPFLDCSFQRWIDLFVFHLKQWLVYCFTLSFSSYLNLTCFAFYNE